MRKRRQLSLFDGYKSVKKSLQFGGSLVGKNNAKTDRPFSSRHPMHIVLRSYLDKGDKSLLNYSKRIRDMAYKQAKSHFVEVMRFVNVGNHLHVIVKAKRKEHL